jgi:hypothetical protein
MGVAHAPAPPARHFEPPGIEAHPVAPDAWAARARRNLGKDARAAMR